MLGLGEAASGLAEPHASAVRLRACGRLGDGGFRAPLSPSAERGHVVDALHELIERAYRSRRDRARRIVEDCVERLPHYQGGLSDAFFDEVQESILHHLAVLYRITLETGRPLTAEDLEYSVRLARKRAGQGVPLGEFLTFFLIGLMRAWEHLMEGVGDAPELRDALLDRVSAVLANQARLMSALTEAYVEERERRSRFREQDTDDLAQLLLADEPLENVIETRARTLGIPLDTPHTIAVFGPPIPRGDEEAGVGSEDLRLRLAARLPGAELWVGRAREGFVALLPEDPDPKVLAAAVEDLLGESGRVGVGGPGRNVQELRRAAGEALRAFRIGFTLGGDRRVRTYREVAVLDLVGVGGASAEGFVRSVLGPLATERANAIYLETLRQLAAQNYRIKLAAADLSVHPHTLSYRIRQMHRRFGIDLEDPEVRLRVQLALRILDATRRR